VEKLARVLDAAPVAPARCFGERERHLNNVKNAGPWRAERQPYETTLIRKVRLGAG
jgi:hypothetical protein